MGINEADLFMEASHARDAAKLYKCLMIVAIVVFSFLSAFFAYRGKLAVGEAAEKQIEINTRDEQIKTLQIERKALIEAKSCK